MNRKQKERMEKEKLQDQEDSKKASHNNDLGRFQFPFDNRFSSEVYIYQNFFHCKFIKQFFQTCQTHVLSRLLMKKQKSS